MPTRTRLCLLCLCLLGWSAVVQAAAPPRNQLDRAALVPILSGEYIIVGRRADSEVTYTGRLTFRGHGDGLRFTRTVGGHTVRGKATLEMTVVGDPAPVLRMSFVLDGQRYDGTYQWTFDLDNYARFTGYVYRPETHAAGLEMLFPAEPAVRE